MACQINDTPYFLYIFSVKIYIIFLYRFLELWHQCESKYIVLIRNHVLLTRPSAPAILTSKTHLLEVDANICEVSRVNVWRVAVDLLRTLIKRLLSIVKSTTAKCRL